MSTARPERLFLGLLCITACAPLPFGDSEDDAEKPAASQEVAAEVAEPKTTPPTPAEPAKPAPPVEPPQPEAPEKDHPVILSEFEVEHEGSLFGDKIMRLHAVATIKQTIGADTYVHVKSRCIDEGKALVEVAVLHPKDYTKQLHTLPEGESLQVTNQLFLPLRRAPQGPCSFEFRLAGFSGISLPIGEACYDGSKMSPGACSPAVAVTPPGDVENLAEVSSWTTRPSHAPNAFEIDHVISIAKKFEEGTRIYVKAACPADGRTLVDVQLDHLSARPFGFEPGESITRTARFFTMPALQLPAPPTACNLTVSAEELVNFRPGPLQVLERGCLRNGAIEDGRCDSAPPSLVPPRALGTDTFTVDNVGITPMPSYQRDGTYGLQVRTDLTVTHPLLDALTVDGEVQCRVGKDKVTERVYFYGAPLNHLEAGETARLEANAFGMTPLSKLPTSCVLTVRVQNPGTYGVEPTKIGKFCLKKNKIKKC